MFSSCFNSQLRFKNIYSRKNTYDGNKQREKGKNSEVYKFVQFPTKKSNKHRQGNELKMVNFKTWEIAQLWD